MILFCVIMLYPIVWLLSSSFKEDHRIMATAASLIPEKVVLDNYIRTWKGIGRQSFLDFFGNTVLISVSCTVASVFSNTWIAYGFARLQFAGRRMWFAIMIVTLCLPGMVTQIPKYLLFNKIGWVGTFAPLIVPAFFGWAKNVFMLMMFMRNVPKEMDEAATIDGCGRLGLYFRIIVPLVKPAVVMVGVLRFITAWNDFYGALIYLNKPSMYPIGLALKLYNDETSVQYGPMMAMSVLSLIPIFILFSIFQRSLIEGIATTGIKG